MSLDTSTDEATSPTGHQLGEVILKVTDLKKHFPRKTRGIIPRADAPVKAVDGISFELRRGETLGIVGESGCGKSTAGRTVLQLLAPTDGTIEYLGEDITGVKGTHWRKLRTEMQMVFQDPYGSLNPRQTIGTIVGAPFVIQRIKPERGVKAEVQELLERVGLNPEHYNRYPHEFSGGQRQRIGIARAIALRPHLIVCDEPVSALDVSIQAQVVNLLEDIQNEFNLSYVFIAHDLSVVRHISDRVAVMYLGKVMEVADRDELYANPHHPYTQALLSAVPLPDPRKENKKERILLTGDLPSPINPPSGCVFHTRCPKYRLELSDEQKKRCVDEVPGRTVVGPLHEAYCHYAAPPTVEILELEDVASVDPAEVGLPEVPPFAEPDLRPVEEQLSEQSLEPPAAAGSDAGSDEPGEAAQSGETWRRNEPDAPREPGVRAEPTDEPVDPTRG